MSFYLVSGIAGLIISTYSFAKYYSKSGVYLLSDSSAKDMIKNNKKVKLIDVRTKVEWDFGHHPQAIHIPMSDISKKNITLIRKFDNNNIKEDDILIFYCNTGQRARIASEILFSLGYKNVYYLENSYKDIL